LAILRNIFLIALAIVLGSTAVLAQTADGGPDPATVRVRIGPLWLNPSLSLTNAGVDTNVFNDADDQNPKRDFNVTVTPQTQLWLRMGRTWLSSVIKEDIVWYKKYANQRSANNADTLTWTIPLTRISFKLGAGWTSSKDRPGFEIDARVLHHVLDFNALTEIQVSSRTFIGVQADRAKTTFDQNAVFLGTDLRNALSRVVTAEGLTARHQLTPLTSFTVEVLKEQDRFEFSPLRNSDSTSVNVGLKFDPFALINGSAQIGYTNFTPVATDLAGFKGTTALVNLGYVLGASATKVNFAASRGVEYSFDLEQPYYVQTGFTASVGQQIYGPVDVEGRLGRQALAYRTRVGAIVQAPNRSDHVRSYGGGLGYRFGGQGSFRLALNIDYTARDSAVTGRQYHGLRYGTAVTYGQ
jgi:hypothetical protein